MLRLSYVTMGNFGSSAPGSGVVATGGAGPPGVQVDASDGVVARVGDVQVPLRRVQSKTCAGGQASTTQVFANAFAARAVSNSSANTPMRRINEVSPRNAPPTAQKWTAMGGKARSWSQDRPRAVQMWPMLVDVKPSWLFPGQFWSKLIKSEPMLAKFPRRRQISAHGQPFGNGCATCGQLETIGRVLVNPGTTTLKRSWRPLDGLVSPWKVWERLWNSSGNLGRSWNALGCI